LLHCYWGLLHHPLLVLPANHIYGLEELVKYNITHLVWPHRSQNLPGRPRARRISPRKSPSFFPYFTQTTLKVINAGRISCLL